MKSKRDKKIIKSNRSIKSNRNNRNKKQRKIIKTSKKGTDLFDETLLPVTLDAPTYLPKRKIRVDGILPDELLFAYEWADNPNNVKKALSKAGIIDYKDGKKVIEKLEYEYTHNPRILQAYRDALFNKLESLQITNNKIDSHLGIIAFTDRGLCKRPDGSNIPVHELPWEIRQCISEYEEKMFYPPKGHPYKKTRIKFHSSVEALRMLRKNNDSDNERAVGMTKAMATGGGVVNISNYNNCGNSFQNGDIYNDNSTVLDVSKLKEEELNVLLKVMKKQIPESVQSLEQRIDEIMDEEIIEADVMEIKEELAG